MTIEELKSIGLSDYSKFFNCYMELLSEISRDIKEAVMSEDKAAVARKVENLEKLSNAFKEIDLNKIPDWAQKSHKYLGKALNRTSNLYNYIVQNVLNKNP